MDVTRYSDVKRFLERVSPTLSLSPSENNVILGIASMVAGSGSSCFAATVEDAGELALAALWTPPHRLLLSRAADAPVQALATYLREQNLAPPGVLAPTDTARAFARSWSADERGVKVTFRQRIYEVTRVVPPTAASGSLRLARADEEDVLTSWARSFHADAEIEPISEEAARKAVASRTAQSTLFVWEDGGVPVSMAALARSVATRVAINYVYTPDALRGRGYAKACVAALSQRELAAGKAAVCLVADLANPVSNRVYLSIGYVPVTDADVLDFV
jgi:predicted GNAT family acetyltransferase